MSVFAFILLLLSRTHPDRRCAIADVGIRWAEAAVGGPGESARRRYCQVISHVLISGQYLVISHAREPGVYGER